MEFNERNKDLRIYAFENALNIIQNSATCFSKDTIKDIFELADKIYNYINKDGKQE